MEMLQNITALSDDDLFSEWRDWFTYYRNKGELPAEERKYFQDLSSEMRKRGLVSKSVPTSSGWYEDAKRASE